GPPRDGEYRNRARRAAASLADLQRGHADETLCDKLPGIREVLHGRDFEIPPLAQHHAHRQPGRADGGGVVAEGPIPNRHPCALQYVAPERLRGLRRPEALARHLLYRDAGLVRAPDRVSQGKPGDGRSLGTRDLDTARAERPRHERPGGIVDRADIRVGRRRERGPARPRPPVPAYA